MSMYPLVPFSIYRHISPLNGPACIEHASKDEQVAAGYTLYGSSTMFVYTSGQGVNGFTLTEEGKILSFSPGHENAG